MTRNFLAEARVITIGREQVEALPPVADARSLSAADLLGALNETLKSSNPPFTFTYLSLDNAVPVDGVDGVWRAAGGGVAVRDGVVSVIPFITLSEDAPLSKYDASKLKTVPGALYVVGQETLERRSASAFHRDERRLSRMEATVLERVVASLFFLQSANVGLEDAEVTRQDRRRIARKGGSIALAVKVKTPRRSARPQRQGESLEFSHRFEVRGHYKHFPVGTKLADSRPDKLVDHPTLGQCRRIWCPPFVKGPEDKPLIPKLRVVDDPVTHG